MTTTTIPTTATIGVYLRVSSDVQKKRGAIETQRPDIERYLSAYGATPYGWYEDEAVSGHWVPFGERPQGRRLLADAIAGHVKLILVWRLDRFGRDAGEILRAVQQLEDAGARLISLKESFDTRESAGRLMLGVLASVAAFEWESIVERSAAGMARKLSNNGWMGGAVPLGYRIDGRRPHSKLVIDETTAETVRTIFTLCTEDGLSTTAIATRLNDAAVPVCRGA